MKRLAYIMYVVPALFLLASCSGTRNLQKPQLDLPERLAEGCNDSLTIADMQWWEVYTDPTLSYIISRTLEHNRDILIAAARVEELRQLYGVDKLNYLPVVRGVVGADHETNHYHGKAFSSDSETDLKASLRWEVDLWGGLSQAQRKSAAQYMASVEEKRAMEMTLISEAATAYMNLVAYENELNIVRRTLQTRQEALDKTRLRFEGGLTSEIVYQQAKVELATTAAMVPNLERRISLAKNAITLLMGSFPEEKFAASTMILDENVSKYVPVGLPSTLMERRPDLRASELRLQAACANVGVAYSNQFPKFAIDISGGWENDDFAHLLQSPFSYILGNITGTIFDFGRNRRKYKAAIAAYEQSRLAYEKAVLTAFTEVNSAIVTFRKMQETVTLRAELRDAALKYVDLANKQYIGGTINYIDVLDAHRRYFDAQINLSNAVRDEYLAMINLYKTLGGGWSVGQPAGK